MEEVGWKRWGDEQIYKWRHFDRSGEPEGSAKQNLLHSSKISPFRCATVEMTTILLEPAIDCVVKGSLPGEFVTVAKRQIRNARLINRLKTKDSRLKD